MSDLLPPSPAPFPVPSRSIKSPNGLPQPNSTASSSTTSLNSLGSHPNLSSSDLRLGSSDPTLSSHARSLSLGGPAPPPVLPPTAPPFPADAFLGPPIRPLDLGPLVHSHAATHDALARTVDELQQWMTVVEAGLTHMLDRTARDTIEEEAAEAEDVVVYERAAARANGRAGLGHGRDGSFAFSADGRATPGAFALPVAME